MPAGVFDQGPPITLLRKAGLIRSNDTRVWLRVLFLIGLAWLPLAVLTGIQQLVVGDRAFWSFLRDIGVHARFLVAAPLLVIGESWCFARLSRCASYLVSSGIIRAEDRNTFQQYLTSTGRRLNSIWADVLGAVLVYAFVLVTLRTVFSPAQLPLWHAHWDANGPIFSPAGYWHVLISAPLLMFQLFGWAWRQVMWWRLLRLTSKLPLRLFASHPDRSGGLKFASTVLRGYWPLCFALGVIAAGRAANQMQAGASLYDFRFVVLGLVAFVLVFTLVPFTVFIPRLISLSDQGTLAYDAVANGVGERFEAKWLNHYPPFDSTVLEVPDFSATTDLNSVVNNALDIQLFPVRLKGIYELILVTLLPFIPVMLAFLPLDTILSDLGRLIA